VPGSGVFFGGFAVFFVAAGTVAVVVIDGGRPRLPDITSVVQSGLEDGAVPFVEADANAAIAEARNPQTPRRNAWLAFALSFTAFVYWMGRGHTLFTIALLVVALFVHEGGHWLAMRAFGYRDTRIFFIPFFGAVTAGRKLGAPGWQECIVLLMGPTPGIVLGIALLMLAHPAPGSPIRVAASTLLVLNTVNLLPLSALDGGRLMNRLLFSRHPLLETVAGAAMALGTAALGYAMHVYVLGGIGYGVDPIFRTPNGASKLPESGRWENRERSTRRSSSETRCA
jgi:Zn-dependent protease